MFGWTAAVIIDLAVQVTKEHARSQSQKLNDGFPFSLVILAKILLFFLHVIQDVV